MAKGTVIFLGILALIAVLLFGINLGKKIGNPNLSQNPGVMPSVQPTEMLPSPTVFIPSPTEQVSYSGQAITTFSDNTCGYSFSYPGSFIRQKTANERSVVYLDQSHPQVSIAATCAPALPRPSLGPDRQENVTLGGVSGILYHDVDPRGIPREEIIVKHPVNGMEIIIAGSGEIFQTVRSSFKFI